MAVVPGEALPEHGRVLARVAELSEIDLVVLPATRRAAPALVRAAADVVVVFGWSSASARAAIAWSRLASIPYVLVVEHEPTDPEGGWRGAVGETMVTTIVAHAAGVLVSGASTRRAVLERGAPPERVRLLADTVDVEALVGHADRRARMRPKLREVLGAGPDDVVVLSAGPLAPEARFDDLVHALAAIGDERLVLVLAGDGPALDDLVELAHVRDLRLVVVRDRERAPQTMVDLTAAADVFALLSEREAWAHVVIEAAACGLPLVLSDRVGAAHDLLVDGENGTLVRAGDVDATAASIRSLADDPALRASYGARSRERARTWAYGPSVEGIVSAVREAVAGHR